LRLWLERVGGNPALTLVEPAGSGVQHGGYAIFTQSLPQHPLRLFDGACGAAICKGLSREYLSAARPARAGSHCDR
jgi:hypothetical protein